MPTWILDGLPQRPHLVLAPLGLAGGVWLAACNAADTDGGSCPAGELGCPCDDDRRCRSDFACGPQGVCVVDPSGEDHTEEDHSGLPESGPWGDTGNDSDSGDGPAFLSLTVDRTHLAGRGGAVKIIAQVTHSESLDHIVGGTALTPSRLPLGAFAQLSAGTYALPLEWRMFENEGLALGEPVAVTVEFVDADALVATKTIDLVVCDASHGTVCGDACVDTSRDAGHCGHCNAACPPEWVCDYGWCDDDYDYGTGYGDTGYGNDGVGDSRDAVADLPIPTEPASFSPSAFNLPRR